MAQSPGGPVNPWVYNVNHAAPSKMVGGPSGDSKWRTRSRATQNGSRSLELFKLASAGSAGDLAARPLSPRPSQMGIPAVLAVLAEAYRSAVWPADDSAEARLRVFSQRHARFEKQTLHRGRASDLQPPFLTESTANRMRW